MKTKSAALLAATISLLTTTVWADKLGRQRQLEIIQAYLLATGQAELISPSVATQMPPRPDHPVKCGTPAVMEYLNIRGRLDEDLAAMCAEATVARPTGLDLTVASPSGRFLIHYTHVEPHAVWPGIVDYAYFVALIFDDVYACLVDTLGYPAPPVDGFYPSGGDDAYDVYLLDAGDGVYGVTYLDSAYVDGPGTMRATSFIILDNDYQEIPFYMDRPLEAAKVTAAHEFFHAVQLGIDFTEALYVANGRYWMEMSATWMEEEKYDDINDYYYYLPHFFEVPWVSIQRFDAGSYLQLYASLRYPLFLSQRYDRDLIRDIWLRCADLGPYSDDFLEAANIEIDALTGGQESFASTFHEFALWNYFTGSRADWAPDGIGYEERANYTEFQDYLGDSVIAIHSSYTDTITIPGSSNIFNPDHNAAFYLRLDEVQYFRPDTTYWLCNDGFFPACNDSAQVLDPSEGFDFVHIDSILNIGLDLDSKFPHDWGLSVINRLEAFPDSSVVEQLTLPAGFDGDIGLCYADLQDYCSVALVLSPASADRTLFDKPYEIGYQISHDMSLAVVVEETHIAALPSDYGLQQNYPNPFNPFTTIEYSLPRRSRVNLIVYNILGRSVVTLADGVRPAGTHQVSFDAGQLSSGVYLYRLETGDGFTETRKMVLLR